MIRAKVDTILIRFPSSNSTVHSPSALSTDYDYQLAKATTKYDCIHINGGNTTIQLVESTTTYVSLCIRYVTTNGLN